MIFVSKIDLTDYQMITIFDVHSLCLVKMESKL